MARAFWKPLSLLALSSSVMAISMPAHGQSLDEIVVTAQKKEQNLQDVPIAIAAFDLESIQTNRIEGLEDIGRVAPGVNVTPNSADVNGVQVNIRGIGILDPQVGQDSRVAIYQDGVYLGKTQGLALDLPDLARVEILKGPQGTLYGRNSVAGAVNLISQRPDPSGFSGTIEGELGNFSRGKVKGAINVPISEWAALRLSGIYSEQGGWVENNGPGADFGGSTKYGFRAALGLDLSETLELDVSADLNQVNNEPLFYQTFGEGAPPFAASILPPTPGRQDQTTTTFDNEDGDLTTVGVTGVATWRPADNHELKATVAYREADSSRFVTLLPEVDLNVLNVTINGIPGNPAVNGFNGVLAPLPGGLPAGSLRPDFSSAFTGDPPEAGLFLSPPGGSTNLVHDQFSAELTYTGSYLDDKLDITGGLFYYSENTGTGPVVINQNNANDYLFVLAGLNAQVTGGLDQINAFIPATDPTGAPLFLADGVTPFTINGFLDEFDIAPSPFAPGLQTLPAAGRGPIPIVSTLGGLSQLPTLTPNEILLLNETLAQLGPTVIGGLAGARQSASNTLDIDTQAFAIYGEGTFHFNDQFRLTAGLRLSIEDKDGVGQSFSPFFIDTTDLAGNPIESNISDFNDTVLNPTVVVEYDWNEDLLLYASFKQSYRAGGFNAAAVSARLPGETFGEDFNFGREDINAFEAGFKGTFGDGRFRLNAAGFFYDFTDVQTTVSTNPLIATQRAVVNTDQEVYGFEADALFAITEDFTLRGSYTFIDGEQDDVINPVTGAISPRGELQGTPENQFLVALDYNGDFEGTELFANITFSHKDDLLRVPENGTRLTNQDLLSANFGILLDNDVRVSVWGQNLTDDEFTIDALPFETFAFPVQVFGTPRTYGVTVGYDF